MTHRTTFVLDKTTVQRIERLAARWQVSHAEVVRRSVEQAEKQTAIEKGEFNFEVQHVTNHLGPGISGPRQNSSHCH